MCSTCIHFMADRWQGGHPSPCGRVRWEGAYHRSPQLTTGVDGTVGCPDYEPLLVEVVP